MSKQGIFEDEQEPLIDAQRQEEDGLQHWDAFRNKPQKVESLSAAESKYIVSGIKCLKVLTLIFTSSVVLVSAVVSKGTLLFMTSQIKKNTTRLYCNKYLDDSKQFMVSLPEEERIVWIWLIIFTFMVPELGTFIRSVRIICFKKWIFPTFWEFFWLFITESLPAVGSAILVFVVLPELDVIKGTMLTNATCFIPGLVALFSRRKPCSVDRGMKVILDVAAITAQASAFLVWPLVDGRPILYFIPLSLVLISFGWWENFVSEESPIAFIRKLAWEKKYFKNKTYFMYSILAPWKCLLFLITAIVIITIREGNPQFLFDKFVDGFKPHDINITEIEPIIGGYDINLKDAVPDGSSTTEKTSLWTPLSVWLINISATYVCYAFGKFSCKIMIQIFSFAFPVNLSVPVLLTALIAMCGKYNQDVCAFSDIIPPYLFFSTPSLTYLNDFIAHQYSWIWLIWLLSQTWITIHIWRNNNEKLASTEKLFFKPMYDAFLIDQSIALNRRRIRDSNVKRLYTPSVTDPLDTNKDRITRIYGCGTMWHETKEEMIEFLKSILRMDEDQCAHRIVRSYLDLNLPNYYEYETHILFDDAFVRTSAEDHNPHVNNFVLNLIDSVSIAASIVHRGKVTIKPPVAYITPYGGRLEWTLPGKTKMMVHLKDKAKVRAKKRWSQVMYMYYLLGYRIMEDEELTADRITTIAENTYLLALDGDVDFQPQAVHLLVDRMKRNNAVGAACGRIHPVGSGFMAWYQTFEYAIGHWLLKSTEHVIGCVLCSPGCFSLFRAKALMDDNVLAKYATVSEKARDYIEHDQGEDRWLCTLLLKKDYRVEYCAASDAYTHCPEGFKEFFIQRRRWMPSTIAHNLDLVTNYKQIIKSNENMSRLYILYQIVLIIGTVIGPATIFLMLVGGFATAFKIDQWSSFGWNIAPILLYFLICAIFKSETQLLFAGIISGFYGLIMMAVLVGVMMQIQDNGWLAPSSLFFFCIALEFILSALLHPQEFYCLKYCIIYYVTVPSMYVLLVIYTVFNMNNVSWGTREVTVAPKPQAQSEVIKEEKGRKPKTERKHNMFSLFQNNTDNTGPFKSSCASLFKSMCMCCTDQAHEEKQMLGNIQASLFRLEQKLYNAGSNQLGTDPLVHIEGCQASRISIENEEYTVDSITAPSDDDQEISWCYDGELIRSEVSYLNRKEEKFWQAFINKYLHPLDDTHKKDTVKKDLKDLRDKMVITFFMINSLLVLVVFLLNLHNDVLHIKWPIDPKIRFTYHTNQNEISIEKTYLQLDPIGFVFIICFIVPMMIQFLSMLYHRFNTFSHIMATTTVDKSDKTENLADELIQAFKKIQQIDDDDEQIEAPAARRNTVHTLATNRQKKYKRTIEDLDEAFADGMNKLHTFKNTDTEKSIPVPRKTLHTIWDRRETVTRRRISQMLNSNNIPSHSDNMSNTNHSGVVTFENSAYEKEHSI